MDLYDQLKTLTETPGPSGWEAGIAATIRDLWQPLVDTITLDRIGSLVAVKRGQGEDGVRRRVLVAAHMDEIGLMVTHIARYPDDDSGHGFLRVTNVGGVDIRHLLGQLVIVHGRQNLTGVIGALPNHMLPESKHNVPYGYDDLVVDVGLPAGELRQVVAVGDFVSFRQPLRRLQNGQVTGKSLDNRASVAAVTVALSYLQLRQHTWDVVAVATAQEETALLGAYTSGHAQQPDLAVALDVTFGKSPASKDNGETYDLGGGPTLGLGPNLHPGVYARLQAAAKALEMKVTPEPHARASGTDAYALQVARSGLPTGLIGIPLRYMHTMVETADLADIERAGRLLGEFIARLDDQTMDEIAAKLMAKDE